MDADDAAFAFAGPLPPLRPTPAATSTSQYGRVEIEGQDDGDVGVGVGNGGGDGDGDREIEDGGDPGEAGAELAEDRGGNREDEQEVVDNGVCFSSF